MGFGQTIISNRPAAADVADLDRASWHERASGLYEEMRRPAVGLVRRAYGSAFSEPEIEDVYSSAWLGTLRALERKASELTDDEVRSYLLTAVANHASKEIRRRKRKPVAPLEAAGAVAEVDDSLHDRAEAAESRDLTRDLLSSLPPRRRAVMLLRYGWELEPREICGMVKGLSPRAYRKEITRGVDDLVERIRLVEEGRWCQDREPLLKAFAAGTATEEQALQAQSHIAHCRSCGEFVGKLSGHLHDLGSGLLLPGALEAADGHSTLLAKARDAFDGARDTATGVASRPETSDGIAAAAGARGAGAGGLGVLAKLSAAGTGAKAALACTGGLVAVSGCIAAGIGPVSPSGETGESLKEGRRHLPPLAKVVQEVRPSTPPQTAVPDVPESQVEGREENAESAETEAAPPADVLAPDTPATTAEFGTESAAQPVGSPPAQTDATSDGGAVAQEFGP